MDALGDTRTENREINYVNDPVGKLYRRLLPSAIGSLLTATVASLIDVVILSYFLGPSMLAVVELCMPVYMLVNTLAMLISSGAATLYAHFLGEGDRKEALCWFSASTIHMLICGSVLMLAGLLFSFGGAEAAPQVIQAAGVYIMGDNDSPKIAKDAARQEAMRSAVEQAGVYVESYSRTQNMELTEDDVRMISGAVLKGTH
jgi:hypothetical protein